MKYFIDQEFIEAFHKPWLGKRRHFIDLISIGIVAEDGREYYAISSEYDYNKASDWVIENVIHKIYNDVVPESFTCDDFGNPRYMPVSQFHKHYGKPIKQIAAEIYKFMNPAMGDFIDPIPTDYDYIQKHNVAEFDDGMGGKFARAQPDIYGYYSDYDWVLFCSLFGTMMQLPKGLPMYCRDLKQTLDERAERNAKLFGGTVNDALAEIKRHVAYPKAQNEHNAVSEARFNRDLYNFLQKL